MSIQDSKHQPYHNEPMMSPTINLLSPGIDPALSISNTLLQDLECAICHELLSISPYLATTDSAVDSRVATLKAHGNVHYVHHACIMASINVNMASTNTFPVDPKTCHDQHLIDRPRITASQAFDLVNCALPAQEDGRVTNRLSEGEDNLEHVAGSSSEIRTANNCKDFTDSSLVHPAQVFSGKHLNTKFIDFQHREDKHTPHGTAQKVQDNEHNIADPSENFMHGRPWELVPDPLPIDGHVELPEDDDDGGTFEWIE
ncbi:predicted protein [Plenodomus lingam JN3]|uniref:Predicted protein n=1 Tax=Leptosphaeria maculans (strain JN3 / isolate v23.1.3 / race Av1-4-5-6-7-8) TaxID=985895 RepID=E4ZTY2_LEPMJ|nr:predicted protein [Plenodomus lingam JN3]CBX94692.1 predicted protein [Plenodomus lingam JN3]